MNLSPQFFTPPETALSPGAPPTHQESQHLASLVSAQAAQIIPNTVPEIVSSVFHMCRNRWVADFLFSKEMTPLSALTSCVNLNHAITCTVTITSVERLIGLPRIAHAPPNPFDMHMHGDYVFIPEFSVGPISVGFGIQNCSVKCQAEWGLRPGQRHNTALSHFRYVRDDEKGILVNVRDETGCDYYKIDYMEHETATKRRRQFLTVEREAVQNLLSQDTAGIDPQKLIPAIRLVQSSEEFRDCPLCGIQKGASCNCKLELQMPKHPLDFRNMFINMSSHLGSFEGVTSSRFVTAGMELMSAKLGSRITIDCKVDSDLLDRLSKWAITDQLKNVQEDPLRCIMPAADEQMTDTAFGVIGSGEVTEIETGEELPEHEMDAILEVDALVDEMPQPVKGINLGDVTSSGLDNVLGLNKDGMDDMAHREMFGQLSPETSEGDDEVQLVNEIAREAQLAFQAENGVGEHSAPSGASTTVVQGMGIYDLHDDVTLSEEARLQQEKERKAELRRQRNREAAQRSNAKRKEKNDTLKAALREERNKAAELRARELALREENIRLRRLQRNMLSPT